MDTLLTPQEAADQLGTPLRFIRRLVAERRIGFVKVGRYVRIPARDLQAFVEAGRVEAQVFRSSGPSHRVVSR